MSLPGMGLPGIRRILLLPLLAVSTGLAHAGAWMDFDGAIPGGSTSIGHENWIDIDGFELEGALEGISGFNFRKRVDKASPALFLACARGTHFPNVTLDFDRSGVPAGEMRLVRIDLENVVVEKQRTSRSYDDIGGDESIDIKFVNITYIYFLPDSSYVGWDYDNIGLKGGYLESPADPDSDNDGMPDSWEEANGLIVGVNDADGDLDGDGLSNVNEFRLGTDPQSGSSFFKATLAPDAASPGNYLLTWNSVDGKVYVVEWSPDLVTSFTTLQTHTATGTSSTVNIGAAGAAGFYRVRPQTTP